MLGRGNKRNERVLASDTGSHRAELVASIRYVDETYGEWKILEILENMWRFTDFNLLLEYTFNKSFPALMKEWKYFYKKQMYPILEDYDSPSSISNQITSRGINVSPVINIEDNEIYFLTNRMGYSDVYSKL